MEANQDLVSLHMSAIISTFFLFVFSSIHWKGGPKVSGRKVLNNELASFSIVHHEATRHPAAPKDAEYPLKAGPIGKVASSSSSSQQVTKTSGPHGASRTVLNFAELPNRYRHPQLTEAEIEAVEVKEIAIDCEN